MIGRSSNVAISLLIFSASIFTVNTANAWDFDMFSFFTKKDKAMPTIVHPSLDAALTAISSYPQTAYLPKVNSENCVKAKVQGAPPMSLTLVNDYLT